MGDGQLREMPHILRQVPWHAAFESNGTVVTFLVTGLRPNQIHREGFGEIVAPILLVFTPGKSGLRVRDSHCGYYRAPFHSLLEVGTRVSSLPSGADAPDGGNNLRPPPVP